MKCFVVVYLSEGVMDEEVLKNVSKHYNMVPGKVWLVADREKVTADEIRAALGMTHDGMLGAIFEIENYGGYGPKALWEYIQTWRNL